VDDYIANYAAHSGLRPVCRPTVERLFGEYDGIDVRAFVVLPEWESTTPFASPHLTWAAESDLFYTRCYFYTYNAWLGRLQRAHRNLRCFGGVHPADPRCVEEFERSLTVDRLAGLKLVPCMQHFFLDDRRLFPVYEQAQARGVPVLVHTGGDPVAGREIFGHPRDVDEVAANFPNLTIIMAHMGIPFFEETRSVLRRHRNVYTDLSFAVAFDDVAAFSARHGIDAPFLTRDFWRHTVATLITDFGCERVLFGSDFPFIRPTAALQELLALDLPGAAVDGILLENARAILRLP